MENDNNGARLSSRLLMIAIDSMNRSFVERNSNRLPTLSMLLREGFPKNLKSTAEIASASVWPTFAAAKSPGHHGSYYPFQFDPSAMKYRRTTEPAWARNFDFEPFWFDISRLGVKSIVLDAAYINPSSNVPCIQVINWSYQSSGAAFSNPPEVLRELRRRFDRRPIGPEVTVPKNIRQTRHIRNSLIKAIRQKADAIIWLSQTYDWQFFLASMYEVHRAGHNLWPVDRDFSSAVDPDAMLAVYIEADNQIARIIDTLDLATTEIVLFSLSGMGINRAQDHFLDRIMRRLNAVYLKEPVPNGPSDPDPNLLSFLRRIVPSKLQYLAVKLLGENIQDWVVNRSLVGGVDWQKTPAFHVLSGGEGYIRFNIKGRERDGFFDPGSPELVRYSDWLKNRLMRITVGDTGAPLITEIVELAERFPGPKLTFLPDLALAWNPEESAETIRSADIGVLHGKLATGRGGNHTPESFSVFFGGRPNPKMSAQVNHIADLGVYARDWARSLQ